MSEYYAVTLQIDRVPDQPDNPEAIGDPVVVAECTTIEGARVFVSIMEEWWQAYGHIINMAKEEYRVESTGPGPGDNVQDFLLD